jgi:hypothetical protein
VPRCGAPPCGMPRGSAGVDSLRPRLAKQPATNAWHARSHAAARVRNSAPPIAPRAHTRRQTARHPGEVTPSEAAEAVITFLEGEPGAANWLCDWKPDHLRAQARIRRLHRGGLLAPRVGQQGDFRRETAARPPARERAAAAPRAAPRRPPPGRRVDAALRGRRAAVGAGRRAVCGQGRRGHLRPHQRRRHGLPRRNVSRGAAGAGPGAERGRRGRRAGVQQAGRGGAASARGAGRRRAREGRAAAPLDARRPRPAAPPDAPQARPDPRGPHGGALRGGTAQPGRAVRRQVADAGELREGPRGGRGRGAPAGRAVQQPASGAGRRRERQGGASGAPGRHATWLRRHDPPCALARARAPPPPGLGPSRSLGCSPPAWAPSSGWPATPTTPTASRAAPGARPGGGGGDRSRGSGGSGSGAATRGPPCSGLRRAAVAGITQARRALPSPAASARQRIPPAPARAAAAARAWWRPASARLP